MHFEDFLGHERVAGAAREQQVDRGVRHVGGVGVQAGARELPEVLRGQSVEFDERRAAALGGVAGQGEGRAVALADAADEQGALQVDVVDQVLQHGERLGVGVVQVVEGEQAAPVAAGEPGQPQHRLGEDDERLGVAVGGPRRPLGHHPAEDGAVGAEVVGVDGLDAEQVEDRLGERAERGGGADGTGPAAHQTHAGGVGEFGGRGRQSGLADAALADDEDGAAVAVTRLG